MIIKATPEVANAALMAIDCQDASNGLAVLNSLARHLAIIPTSGTAERNQHPVTIVVLDKLCSLAHCQPMGDVGRLRLAYDVCEQLARGKDAEWNIL